MLTKKKKKQIDILAHILAIENDYVRNPDSGTTANLFIDIARIIGGDKAASLMIDQAKAYSAERHNITVTGDAEEVKSMSQTNLAENSSL